MEKRVWKVRYTFNGFDMPLAIEATERELVEYMATELGYQYGYSAMTDGDVAAWKSCHQKIYMA